MYTQPVTVLEQFDTKHGSDPIVEDGWVLYPDGARRTDEYGFGMLYEPPEDIRQRGPLMIKYHEIRFQRASKEFNELKQNLTLMVGHARRTAGSRFPVAPPDQRLLDRLENLQAKAQRLQRALNKCKKSVEDELAQHPEVRRQAESAIAHQHHTDDAESRLNNIKI